MTELFLTHELNACTFESLMTMEGKTVRAQPGRLTQRIMLNNHYYFIKKHHGVGWYEIFKNFLQGRFPVLSAKNEWKALKKLQNLGIATPSIAAYGNKGVNPARLHSFLMTEELPPHISLEDLGLSWKTKKPSFGFKYTLIKEVARIASVMHENGINHRDFYICHFLLALPMTSNNVELYLIDLHRAQIRHSVPIRWRIKDLAGLYFSSKDIGLTNRDLLRFIKHYRGSSLHECWHQESAFWKKVRTRGEKLYKRHRKLNP